jgi:hypothetical protein
VRSFLVQQCIAPDSITSKGFGKNDPVADNGTASGTATEQARQHDGVLATPSGVSQSASLTSN